MFHPLRRGQARTVGKGAQQLGCARRTRFLARRITRTCGRAHVRSLAPARPGPWPRWGRAQADGGAPA